LYESGVELISLNCGGVTGPELMEKESEKKKHEYFHRADL
jgi:hypothetical protein